MKYISLCSLLLFVQNIFALNPQQGGLKLGVTPPAGHSVGQPWPLPSSYKQTATAFGLNSATFQFTISGNDCDILSSATDRYYQITFQVGKHVNSPSGDHQK